MGYHRYDRGGQGRYNSPKFEQEYPVKEESDPPGEALKGWKLHEVLFLVILVVIYKIVEWLTAAMKWLMRKGK